MKPNKKNRSHSGDTLPPFHLVAPVSRFLATSISFLYLHVPVLTYPSYLVSFKAIFMPGFYLQSPPFITRDIRHGKATEDFT
jgi:hypothetical protein